MKRTRHSWLAAGTALALAGGLGAVSAPVAQAAKQDPLVVTQVGVPGARTGGVLEFDGSNEDDLTSHGVYGVVYRNNKAKNACTGIDGPNINPFDESTHKKWRRARDEFTATGKTKTLQPNSSTTVSSDESKTTHWSVSATTEVDSGLKWVSSIKVSITGSYGEDKTVSEGQSDTATNPTSDMTQRVAMGVMSDVWAVQTLPWRYGWRNKGDKIYVGDTANSIAERYTVPNAGCYKTGYFHALKIPASVGFGVVEQYPASQTEPNCPFRIEGDDVQLHPALKAGEPDTASNDPKYAIPAGTCVTRSDGAQDKIVTETDEDGRVTGRSAWVELATWPKKGKKCLGPFAASCSKNFWVSTNDVDGLEVKPPALDTWGNQTTFTIRPTTASNDSLVGTHGDFNAVYAVDGYKGNWQLLSKNGGLWQLKQTGSTSTRDGQCMIIGTHQYGEGGMLDNCGDNSNQQFKVVFAGQGSFYIQSKQSPDKCLTRNTSGANYTLFAKCNGTDNNQHWSFTKA
ncbi:hypothetical protein [Kitasatospora sp. GAS1066B]|uniref:hypothetical protein n=1 Tax=Kitasatospora sp. GAS1066B TaxID=3156271 RepID=UPI003514E0C0